VFCKSSSSIRGGGEKTLRISGDLKEGKKGKKGSSLKKRGKRKKPKKKKKEEKKKLPPLPPLSLSSSSQHHTSSLVFLRAQKLSFIE
jgi:hypothetical protein